MGMVVIQPYILVPKLKKIQTKFLHCTGYLNSIKKPIKQDLLLIQVLSKQTTDLSKLLTLCFTAVKNIIPSTVKRYMRDLVKTNFGLLKIQLNFR